MKNTIAFLSIICFAFINLFSSCHRPRNEYVGMTFTLPLSIAPIKDTINIGDTLTFEANFSDSLKEVFSGTHYRLQNFDFRTRVAFNLLRDSSVLISQQPGTAGAFTITNELGGITGLSESFGGVNFLYENDRYKLRTKLVPKQKGVFAISFFSRRMGEQTQL